MHTKEPWSIHHNQPTFLRANGGRKHIGNTDSMGEKKTDEANARRIVACVNACEGISAEALNSWMNPPDGGFGHPHGPWPAHIISLQRAAEAAAQQRDELLAALEAVLPFLTGNYWPGVEADAAIDRAVAIARKLGAGTTATEGPLPSTPPSVATPLEHVSRPDCWCEPEKSYVDPDTGATVYVHREVQ